MPQERRALPSISSDVLEGSLVHVLRGPATYPFDHATDHATWFRTIANALVRGTLWVGERPHTLVEIEFYYSHPESDHVDPYVHGDPIQRGCATWYLHRQGTSYRGGSYKGIDLTFGPSDALGGILIRSLRTPEGELVCGSSLCVDHLLAQTGHASVDALARALGERSIEDPSSPLRIETSDDAAPLELWATARVGLTLKRLATHPTMLDYLARPYRATTVTRELTKGRVQLVVALHGEGHCASAIAERVGSPKPTVERWLAAYEEGRAWTRERASALAGKSLDSLDLCRLLGALAPASRCDDHA